MKISSISQSFSARLSLRILLITAIIFLVAFSIFLYFSRQLVREEAVQHAESTLTNTILRIDQVLQCIETAVNNADWNIKKNINEPDSMYTVTRRLLEKNAMIAGSAIAFEPFYYASKGALFSPYSFRRNDSIITKQVGTADYEYHYMDWYQIPKLLDKNYWSEPYFDKGGGEMTMSTYSKPLYDTSGKLFAIFSADISLEWLTSMVNSVKPYPHSHNIMIGRGGAYIVHYLPERILDETIFTHAMATKDTTVRYIGEQMINGKQGMATVHNNDTLSYMFYAPVKSTGWSVAIICSHEDIFARVDKIESILLLVALLGLVTLFLFCIRTIRHITRPLKQFAQSAVSIAGGNFTTQLPPIKSHDEMGQLAQSFDFMQHSLTNYMEELKTTASNKERIESELRIASEIQMGMVPKTFPPFPDRDDIDLYATLKPAKEVGGDLYNFFIENDKLFLVIGDVSGKGVPASLLMAVTCSLFRSIASHLNDPTQIVKSLNNSIFETNESNMFVTLLVIMLDLRNGHLKYCNAGHNPPVLITPEGEVSFLQVLPNIPVGLFQGYAYEGQEMVLTAGSALFMYTDGLTEAENAQKKPYDEKAMLQEIRNQKGKGPQEITLHILQKVHEHVREAEQSDDLTILTVCYKPPLRKA